MGTKKTATGCCAWACAVLLGAAAAQAQVCEPAPNGFGCVPLACSDIPEEQCIATVVHLDVTTGAIVAVECECLNFNFCHIEFGDVTPFPVGWCPDGGVCEVFAEDTDNDGIEDQFTARCARVGACCLDIDDGPIPYDTCVETDERSCHVKGGRFHPVNTGCSEVQACCLGAMGLIACADMNPHCCLDSGGVPRGPGSTCENTICGEICGGFTGIPCDDPNEFCKFPPGTCDWADHFGICTPVPNGCPDVWLPVCGCDGVTYGNGCEADVARMSIDHRGPCEIDCGPTPDGTGCEPFACSPIPEDRCLPAVLHLDPANDAITVLACECMNFNDCHIEFAYGKPYAVGNCPSGHACQVVGWDSDGDGIKDTLTAECTPAGACCVDISGSPLPLPRCVEMPPRTCEAAGGFFQGIGTTCEPVEACCLPLGPQGHCVDANPLCCTAFGGIPLGPGTHCDNVACGPICGGFTGIPCDDPNEFCKFPMGRCDWADQYGMCTPVPNGCPDVWDPVCGCDGVTYGNACEADRAQVSVDHRGPCERICYRDMPGGIPPCGADEFCKFPEGTCGAHDIPGVCVPVPGACPLLWDPVCGCDGVTYGNECDADAAGVSIRHWGACERPCDPSSSNLPPCFPGEFCKYPPGVCGEDPTILGVCMVMPGGCPDVWDPVCGCDGITYGNECEADAAGVSIRHWGECRPVRCWSNTDCPDDRYCFFHLCAAETGVCRPRPVDCPDVWDPVCGCDGVTYGNACEAARAGVSMDHYGECARICHRLSTIPECGLDQFCKFPPGMCDDTTVLGVCTIIPDACPEIWNPVCGCDGVTYANECFADAAAVSIDYYGECQGPPCAAVRNLAEPELSYCPGVPKRVQTHLNPVEGAVSYGLEDKPPTDWVVTEISNNGVYDPVNGKVKWGPFFAPNLPRSVTYVVVPPNTADMLACFAGAISIDGVNQPIGGDQCIDSHCCPFMEADLPQPSCPPCPFGDCTTCINAACRDGRITLCELIGYACAWLHGCNDDLAGMVRAAYIWMHGECYCWNEGAGNWYPKRCLAPPSGCCPAPDGSADADTGAKPRGDGTGSGQATATFEASHEGRKPISPLLHVPVTFDAPDGTSAVALEFQVPEGWDIVSISDDGEWDAVHRKVKWGPFFDDASRTVTLDVQRRPDASRIRGRGLKGRMVPSGFTGTISFDGANETITVR